MASTGINYGAVNPAETQPYPIESVLAAIQAKDNPAEAHNLLDTYQAQRAAAEGNYNLSLQGQHDFAYNQLAQQMKENYLKAGMEAAKTPGAFSAMLSNPLFADSGYDPNVVGGIETNLRDMQRAEQFQKGATGLNAATEAGFQPNTQQAATATAGLAGPQGPSERLQIANINAAARMAAARLASGPRGPSQSYQVMTPHGPANFSYSGKMTDDQIQADLDTKGVPRIGSDPNKQLPPAAQERGPGGAAKTPQAKNASEGVRRMQQTVLDNIEGYKGHPAYTDIKAGMAANGGKPLIDEKTLRPMGASGKIY